MGLHASRALLRCLPNGQAKKTLAHYAHPQQRRDEDMTDPNQTWVMMRVCVKAHEAIRAEQSECLGLATLMSAIHKLEALNKGLSTEEVYPPNAFAVFESSGKADGTWRALLHDRHPLWRAMVIYTLVADGHVRDYGHTQELRKRVRPHHERLKIITQNHPEGWTVYAIPVHTIENDSAFHGMLPAEHLEVMTEQRHGLFTPNGEFKPHVTKYRPMNPPRSRVFHLV